MEKTNEKIVGAEKGITLMSLAIGMVILLILSSIVYTTGQASLELGQKTAYTLELEIIHTEVERLHTLMKNEKTLIIDAEEFVGEEIALIGEEVSSEQQSTLQDAGYDLDGYRYLSKDYLEKMGVTDMAIGFFVNVNTRSVIASSPYEKDGEIYYTLEELGNGKFIVQNEE